MVLFTMGHNSGVFLLVGLIFYFHLPPNTGGIAMLSGTLLLLCDLNLTRAYITVN